MAKIAKREAEWLLYEELLFAKDSTCKISETKKAIQSSTQSPINYTIRTFKQSFGVSGRFDSEYYQAKFEQNESVIKSKPYAKLGDLVVIHKSIEPGSEAYKESGIPFIRVSNLSPFGLSQSEIYLDSNDFRQGELESLCPKKDTILLSKDGSIGIAYCIREDLECITSGAILHLQIKDKTLILPQYLSLVLNTLITKLQAQRDSGGSIIAHWKIGEIKNVLIPLIENKKQQKIESKIKNSFALREKAKELLENAKIKVEKAIQQS